MAQLGEKQTNKGKDVSTSDHNEPKLKWTSDEKLVLSEYLSKNSGEMKRLYDIISICIMRGYLGESGYELYNKSQG